jgi:hypothetical protein
MQWDWQTFVSQLEAGRDLVVDSATKIWAAAPMPIMAAGGLLLLFLLIVLISSMRRSAAIRRQRREIESYRDGEASAKQAMTDLESALTENKRIHAAQIGQLNTAHQQALDQASQKCRQLGDDHQAALAEMDRAHAAELQQRDSAHAAALQQSNAAHASELRQKDAAHAAELQEKDRLLLAERTAHRTELTVQTKDGGPAMKAKLLEMIQELNAALDAIKAGDTGLARTKIAAAMRILASQSTASPAGVSA